MPREISKRDSDVTRALGEQILCEFYDESVRELIVRVSLCICVYLCVCVCICVRE